MRHEPMSGRNISSLIIMIIMSSSVMSGASKVGQDLWLAVLMAAFLYAPLIFIYGRACWLLPGKNLYEMIECLFGKNTARFLIGVASGYAIMLAALVLRNFVEFTVVISLEDTPKIVLMIFMGVVALYIARQGCQVLGRWSLITCAMILLNVVVTILLASDIIDLSHIQPVMNHSIGEIAGNATMLGAIGIGETVLVMTVMGSLKKGGHPVRVYFFGVVIGVIGLILMLLRNLTILGSQLSSAVNFSAYMAVRIIEFGEFFERIESLVSFHLMLLGLTEIVLCLTAASMGVAKLLEVDDYRRLLMPVCLLVLALDAVIFENMLEMFKFAWLSRYMMIPYQVIIPVMVWAAAEYKRREKSA